MSGSENSHLDGCCVCAFRAGAVCAVAVLLRGGAAASLLSAGCLLSSARARVPRLLRTVQRGPATRTIPAVRVSLAMQHTRRRMELV